MAYTQDNRLLKLETDLGPDVLLIDSFSGSEGISRPFHFHLRMRSEVAAGNPAKVKPPDRLGKGVTIRIELSGGKQRFLHGIVRTFSKEGEDGQFAYYSAEICPSFALTQLESDCRIFQDMSVPQIVETVLNDLGMGDSLKLKVKAANYTNWDYCVQYRETTFNFLSRLMEEEGISYYFEHEAGKHTMVLVDTEGPWDNCPEQSQFNYIPELGFDEPQDGVDTWDARSQVVGPKWVLRDHHFEMPTNNLEVQETSSLSPPPLEKFSVFDYPGDYAKKFNKPEQRIGDVRPEGEKLVRVRMERDERSHTIFEGSGKCRALVSGYRADFKGKKHLESGSYVITTVEHSARQHPAYFAATEVNVPSYSNRFTCLKADVHYRPARVTPKPVIQGLQTARVIDEHPTPQEEIWPDKFGRVLVRFPWDRQAKYACWIRPSQPWGGNQWGHQWIPRVGDEVVVAFLEGDPDRPLIVGSVYNTDNLPPFSLPANKTQSGILTHSSPKGSAKNFNMLRFEDKKGKEEVYLHAEKDLLTVVENDETRNVGNDRTTTIHVNDLETVEKGNHELKVQEGNREATIAKGNDTLTISMGNRETKISLGNDKLTVSTGGVTHEVPLGTHATKAMKVEVNGTADIKLSCGASSIELTPAMIIIQAPLVKIN